MVAFEWSGVRGRPGAKAAFAGTRTGRVGPAASAPVTSRPCRPHQSASCNEGSVGPGSIGTDGMTAIASAALCHTAGKCCMQLHTLDLGPQVQCDRSASGNRAWVHPDCLCTHYERVVHSESCVPCVRRHGGRTVASHRWRCAGRRRVHQGRCNSVSDVISYADHDAHMHNGVCTRLGGAPTRRTNGSAAVPRPFRCVPLKLFRSQ